MVKGEDLTVKLCVVAGLLLCHQTKKFHFHTQNK